MSDFEREVVACFNRFFEERNLRGLAYRLKQHKFSTQFIDVLVDSLDPHYYLAVECKSIRGKKLYFSQHFHTDRNRIHQVDAITTFLSRTGRRGFLAIEFRFGSGKTREAYLLPWEQVTDLYATTQGISIEEFREGLAFRRSGDGYRLPELYP
jgi:Holliday junction resolvase